MKKTSIITLCLILLMTAKVSAKITLPSLVGDNMVLQQSTTVKLWGKSTAGKVTVAPSWTRNKYTASTDKDGKWIVSVKTPAAGGPYSITLNDGQALTIKNVLIGEVWICSGQSNMELPICGFSTQPVASAEALEAITNARKYDKIRLFAYQRNSKETLQDDCPSKGWQCSSPQSIGDFSATAYFFGRQLNQELNIPIGLILTCWGGSSIEAWIDQPTMDQLKNSVNMEIVAKWNRPHQVPSHLYNGMIAPAINYTAKGFIWYQGETNTVAPQDYDKFMVAMVKSWREKWGNEKMPFYYVQLAPYKYSDSQNTKLPLTIEAQYKAQKQIPYSGIAATTDIGHETCIHPGHKKMVGDRLAFLALTDDYGIKGLPALAPTFKSMEIKDGKAFIKFNNTEEAGNSISRFDTDSPIQFTGFEIAGADKVFYPASASTAGYKSEMTVWSDKVPAPVAVRYAFHNYMPCNVHTNFGQPLVPFRTDNW
jgi:sialate O-acetylesterase